MVKWIDRWLDGWIDRYIDRWLDRQIGIPYSGYRMTRRESEVTHL